MQKKSIFRVTIDTEILSLVYFLAIERKTTYYTKFVRFKILYKIFMFFLNMRILGSLSNANQSPTDF